MSSQTQETNQNVELGDYQFGFAYPDESVFKTAKGISPEVVNAISDHKGEPDWMRQFRLRSLEEFQKKSMPNWGADLSDLRFEDMVYYSTSSEATYKSWEDVPESIKETYERIGIPEAERKFLAGVGAQYDSEVVYHNLQQQLADKGVIFTDPETAVAEHPEIVKKYFGTIIPYSDNKFAALNSAFWSGGSFVYVPPGVEVDIPLQAYFRINSENFGQFERTLIIADEGSFVHYIEGCTAPIYTTDSLHSAVVEIIALPGSRVRYTTIQNWSSDVYNLVTKRAVAHERATVEWVDGNIGSKRTMKYPAVYLMGEGAHGEVLSIAFSGKARSRTPVARWSTPAEHELGHHVEEHQQGRRHGELPWTGQGGPGAAQRSQPRRLRRADPRSGVDEQHLPVHGHKLGGREHRARGARQDQRRAAVLSHVAWNERGGSVDDDRQRLPRPAREAASHGVRRGAESAHRARDGRIGRLTSTAKR